MMTAHQIIGHGRNKRARKDEGAGEREYYRFGQRPEQIAGDAAELENRPENDAQAEQREEGGNDNLLSAVEYRLSDVLALLKVIIDVLNGDCSIVDQNSDRKRQAAQSHHVDGLAEPGKQGERKQDGERDFNEDDNGRAPAAEEYQDHQADKRGRQRGFADDAEHRSLDENGLIADGVKVQARRKSLLDPRQQRFYSVNHIKRRGRAGFEN